MRIRERCVSGLAGILLSVIAGCGASEEQTSSAPVSTPESAAPAVSAPADAPAQSAGGPSAAPQGTPTVDEVTKPKVDIIFVVDNSPSMSEKMDQIKKNVNAFAKTIETGGLDSHVIFITSKATDPSASGNVLCVPPPLAGPNCADNLPTFAHIHQNVESASSLVAALWTFDNTGGLGKGWNRYIRYESTKIFIEVTDDSSGMTAESFDEQLLAKGPPGTFGTPQARKYVFHSIVTKPAAEKAPSTKVCGTGDRESVDYQKLSLLTGGVIDEVCKSDYSNVLAGIAANVVATALQPPKPL